MNREIKFRVWDYDVIQEKYVMRNFQSIQNNCGAYFFEPQKYQPNPHILMQFTGFQDKNGKEIYEGDILESFVKKESFKCVVEYIDNGFYCRGLGSWQSINPLSSRNKTVIGNIFENKELIKYENN